MRYMILILTTGLILSCHSNAKQDKLISLGLIESVIGRGEVKSAMTVVNKLIQPLVKKEVLCGWEAKAFRKGQLYYFLTQPDGLPLQTIAQSSKENQAIFISSSWRSICDKTFQLAENDSVLRIHALTLVLLHELGHIINNRRYAFVGEAGIRLDSLQFKNNKLMNDEVYADFFAAEIIKQSTVPEASQLKKDVELLYQRVDYYFYNRYGVHGSPLSMTLAEPAKRFGDLSYTHPNLNLRMHLLSYLINPTTEKLETLRWVQEERKRYFNTNTFTPDVWDRVTYLKKLPDDDSLGNDQ